MPAEGQDAPVSGIEQDFIVVTMLQVAEGLAGMAIPAIGFLELRIFDGHPGKSLFVGMKGSVR